MGGTARDTCLWARTKGFRFPEPSSKGVRPDSAS